MQWPHRFRLPLLAAWSGAIIIAGCDAAAPLADSGSSTISVRVEPSQLTVNDGATGTVRIFQKGAFGSDKPLGADAVVRWESSDSTIAAVAAGVVNGQRPGQATISAHITFNNGLAARLTSTVTVNAVPTRIELIRGDGQTGEVATTLPEPVEIRVLDRHGNAVPGLQVSFVQKDAAGHLNSAQAAVASAVADAQGTASTPWVLTPRAGTQQMQPTVKTSTSEPLQGPVLNAQARPAQPAAVQAVTGDSQTGTIGGMLPEPVVIRVIDRFGNGVPDEKLNWTVRTGGGSLQSPSSVTDANGLGSFRWVLGQSAGPQEVLLRVTGPAGPLLLTATAQPPGATRVSIAGGATLNAIDAVAQLTAAAFTADNTQLTGVSFEWSSANPAVVSVDATGKVKALANGSARIHARHNGKADSVTVIVQQAVAQFSVTPAAVAMLASGTAQLGFSATDANGYSVSAVSVTWSSSAPTVVSVDAAGRIVAHRVGTAQINATVVGGSRSAHSTVSVTAAAPTVTTIEITPTGLQLTPGDSVQLQAVVRDENNQPIAGVPVVWASSAPAVATVSAAGRLKAVALGSATISATAGGKTGTAGVVVQPPAIAAVTIAPGLRTIDAIGHSSQLSASVTDAAGKPVVGATVTWSTPNPDVVDVSVSGKVTAKAVGAAFVIAMAGSARDTTEFTVRQVPATIELATTAGPLAIGSTRSIEARVKDAAGTIIAGATPAWKSSAPLVATVSNGTVTALAAGSSNVTASVGTVEAAVQVLVEARAVESVTLSHASLALNTGASQQVTATVRYTDGGTVNDAVVDWKSSATGVATVTNGLVRGITAGSATITASLGGKSANVTAAILDAVPPLNNGAKLPELPRVYVDTRMPASPGKVISVPAGGDLQAAINSAVRGDVIELQAGATFRGSYTLPAKAGSGWIVIRSSAHGQLPEGVRVRPTDAPRFATLLGGESNRRVLQTADGASHWRIVGLQVGLSDEGGLPGVVNTVVELTYGSSNIVLDRTYVHGVDGQSLQRCVVMNNAMSAVIDSWLDKCHAKGFDSQAIIGWHGPGPYKIVNNHLAGAGENIMFGGAKIGDGDVPSDIEIRRNHIFKPLSWQGGVWTVKNSFELKIAERVLFEGNIIENNWADAQVGFAINLKSENRDIETRPTIATRDVTIRNNMILNSRFGLTINESGSTARVSGDGRTERVLIENNIWELEGRAFQLLGGIDLWIVNNTSPVRTLLEGSVTRLVFRGNLVEAPFKGSGLGEGIPTLEAHAPNAVFLDNGLIGGNAALYPVGNFFPASVAQAPAGVGANLAIIQQATAGVR